MSRFNNSDCFEGVDDMMKNNTTISIRMSEDHVHTGPLYHMVVVPWDADATTMIETYAGLMYQMTFSEQSIINGMTTYLEDRGYVVMKEEELDDIINGTDEEGEITIDDITIDDILNDDGRKIDEE